jgi:hypothetical protein
MNAGAGAVGVILGVFAFNDAVEQGNPADIIINGSNVVAGAGSVAVAAAQAAGTNVSPGLAGAVSKLNVVGMIVSGIYAVSQETETSHQIARGAAVATTAAAGYAAGALVGAAAVGSAGVAAGAIVVATPVVAAVATGLVLNAAADAYIVGGALAKSIRNQEGIKIDSARAAYLEPSGGPSLQKYTNLRQVAILDSATPGGQQAENRQQHSRIVNGYEYSKDPAALDQLATEIQGKIDGYDKTIADNTSWYGTSGAIEGLFGNDDEIGARREAQIERARFVAAQEELRLYREEVHNHNTELAAANPSGAPVIDDQKWTSYFNPATLAALAGKAADEFGAVAEVNTPAPQLAATNDAKSTPVTPGMA